MEVRACYSPWLGRVKHPGSLGGRTSAAFPFLHCCEHPRHRAVSHVNEFDSMSLAVSALAFLTTIWGQGIVFTWLLNLTGISALLVWGSIGLISFRFRAAWKAQGRPLSDLPYTQPLFPLLPIGVVVLATLMFIAEGYSAVKVQPFSARVSVCVAYQTTSLTE